MTDKTQQIAKIQYRAEIDADGWHTNQEVIDLTLPNGDSWKIVESDSMYGFSIDFVKDGKIVHYSIDNPKRFLEEEFNIPSEQAVSISHVICNIFTIY